MKKKLQQISANILILFSLLFVSFNAFSQAGTAVLIEIKNLVQTSPSEFQYEIWCTNTGSTSLGLRGYSWGLNTAIGLNQSGYLTQSFISRDASLSSIPAISVGQTATPAFPSATSACHFRGTTTNATAGNEVPLTPLVPLRLATLRINKVTTSGGTVASPWTGSNINPFINLGGTLGPMQLVTAAGKTQCVTTMIITPPGTSFAVNGTTNTAASGTFQGLSGSIVPSPTGGSPFLINSTGGCNSIVTTVNATACESYTWSLNGVTYTASGVYSLAIAQSGNPSCFDTTYLNLTINQATHTSQIAYGCTSYTWSNNSTTYTASGTYTTTNLNSSGCANTDTLHLSIYSPSTSHTVVSACNNYIWSVNGGYYSNSGTYYYYGYCTSDTLDLTINDSTQNSTSLSSCGSYIWPLNNVIYTNSGTYTFTSLNVNGCVHTEILNLTITPLVGSSMNATACETYTWASNAVTYTSSGQYYNMGSCGTDTLNLTINNNSTSSTSVTACDSYTWAGSGLTYTNSGTYSVTSLNAAGCLHTNSLVLTINHSTSNVTNVTQATAYFWSVTNTSYPVSGTYTGTTLNSVGCVEYDTLNLTILVNSTTVQLTVKNMVQTSPNTFRYEVWLTNTGNTALLLRGYSFGLNHTTNLANGGTLSHSFISRDAALSTLPNVTPGYNLSLEHLRATTTLAVTGNEVALASNVPIRLATMQVSSTANWINNFNPFLPTLSAGAIQVTTQAGKTQCVVTAIVTPPGTSYSIIGTGNVGGAGAITGLSANMIPEPTGPNPFLLTNCAPYGNNNSLTVCDSYTWFATGVTYTISGIYYYSSGCNQDTLNLTVNNSSSSTTYITTCNTYTWIKTGLTYTASGIYTASSLNAGGCPVHDTLNLSITPGGGTNTSIVACDSYIWPSNGLTYTGSGVFYNTTSCGMDTLNLVINSSSSNTTTVSACSTYLWVMNGSTYTGSGIYIATSMNASGCTHTEYLYLTIHHDVVTTQSVTVSSASYTWSVNGVTYTASGIYTNTTLLSTGCTQTQILQLTLNPVPGASLLMEFTNLIQTGPDKFRYDVMLTNVGSTSIGLRGYAWGLNTSIGLANGGTMTQSFVSRDPGLLNIPSLSLAATYIATGACANTYHLRATTVNATAGNEYLLTGGVPVRLATIEVSTTTSWPASFNPFIACGGLSAIQISAAAGKTLCVVTAIVTPPGTSYAINSPGNAPSSTTIQGLLTSMVPSPTGPNPFLLNPASCSSSIVHVNVNACDSYTWTSGNGNTYTASGTYANATAQSGNPGCYDTTYLHLTIGNSTSASTTIITASSYTWIENGLTYTASGTYTATSLNASGCVHTATLNLTILSANCSLLVIEDQPVSCHGNNDASIQATANPSINVVYSLTGPSGPASNMTGFFDNLAPGTYTVSSSDGSCSTQATITLLEPDSLDISFITDSTVSCYGNDGALSVNITGGTNVLQGYLTWWTNAAGDTLNDVLTNNFALSLSGLTAGNYNVAVEDDHGCFYSESTAIQVADPIVVSASFNSIICHGGSTTITPSSIGGVTYLPIVYEINGLPNLNSYVAGTYTITAIDAVGCSASTVITITDPPIITGSTNVTACNSYTFNGITYTAAGTYTTTFTTQNGCDSVVTLTLTLNNGVSIAPKALLSGAYTGGGMMQDNLRTNNVLPLTEPYTLLSYTSVGCPGYNGGETMNAAMLNVSGNNAIVDWVHIEIRSADATYSLAATKNALIQRDGDIVDVTGAPLYFNCLCPGNYYVSIKHRNHLGVMTASSYNLTGATTLIDFTTSAPVWTKPGVFSPARETSGAYRLLWPGDTRLDKNVKYNGLNNDKEPILNAVGIATPNNILNAVYRREDANMDSKVKYNNADNDKNFILNKLILSGYPSGTANDVILQHTPN